jgi:hypothetical protein
VVPLHETPELRSPQLAMHVDLVVTPLAKLGRSTAAGALEHSAGAEGAGGRAKALARTKRLKLRVMTIPPSVPVRCEPGRSTALFSVSFSPYSFPATHDPMCILERQDTFST